GYPYGAWLIKEGDILAKPVSQGAADIFHALIDVESHIGHASMITAFQQGDDRLYAHSEVMDGFEERDVMAGASESLLYRPNFALTPLFTEQGVNRLLEMGTVLYDARYMEGVEDEDGRISLYCTEFIHFIFL